MCVFLQQTTFSRDTDGRQNVVTRNHYCSDVGIDELFEYRSGAGFQFVFEDNESDEAKATLDFFTCHLLDFYPTEFLDMAGSAANYAIALVRIMR